MSDRGDPVAAFNVIYSLWLNAGVALLHHGDPDTPNLQGLLQCLHNKARPLAYLTTKELARFYGAGQWAWRFLQQAKRGELQGEDVRAFDIALERVFRDLAFCFSLIRQG